MFGYRIDHLSLAADQQMCNEILFLPEICNRGFPINKHGQCRCLYTPDGQPVIINLCKCPRSVHPDQPVRLCPADGCFRQVPVFFCVFQCPEALPDGRVFHGRDPQPLHRHMASGQFIYTVENALAFSPRIACIYGVGERIAV